MHHLKQAATAACFSFPPTAAGNPNPRHLQCLESYPSVYYPITMNEYEIQIVWDGEACVWVAQNDEIPVVLENGSLDLLIGQISVAVPEILELNGKPHKDVYLNFTAKRKVKVIS